MLPDLVLLFGVSTQLPIFSTLRHMIIIVDNIVLQAKVTGSTG